MSDIWNAAIDLGNAVHRHNELATLRRQLRLLGAECGDCAKWMKSRACPKEKNLNGINRGPSMSETACREFAESWSVSKRRIDLENKIASLTAPNAPERRLRDVTREGTEEK